MNAPPAPVSYIPRRSVSRAPSARDAPPRHSAAKPYSLPSDSPAAVPLSPWRAQCLHLPDSDAIDKAPPSLPVLETNEACEPPSNEIPMIDPYAPPLSDALSDENTASVQRSNLVLDSELIVRFRLVYRPSDHIPHDKPLTPTSSQLPLPDPFVPSLELAPWDDTDAFMPARYRRNSPSITSDDWDVSESPPFPPQYSNSHLAFYKFMLEENSSPATHMAD